MFPSYLKLIRRLITTYTLEPAGSHGVWGLDDHAFIPYIFGSAQLGPPMTEDSSVPVEGSREDAPEPSDVTKPAVVERERKRNLYFDAIGFIYDVKKGPFWEHSPILYDISGIRDGWGKVNKVVRPGCHYWRRRLTCWNRACSRCTMPRSYPNSQLYSTFHSEVCIVGSRILTRSL